ncbi:alpha/beta fold hydrolase [Mangrovimonas yunxiaonensis]|uniref:alpha/beta fold hydrolase n=1 Tax=Mangrovimonas yunxiaonensis TaxID=1197477 RepID=UPI00068AD1F7|nr:alpha/beta hydrolase [Mangrovimonas yunxiaonensis]GGH44495.1 3-oxoadipate enol-lactonase [Mangrovimonas yunxiaonensis]
MKHHVLKVLVLMICFTAYGQVKVNPNGKFFNYNGTKIYYEDTGSGEPLLLLHNFFKTADSWKPFVKVYSKQFRTIAVDMVGHGRSDIYDKDNPDFSHKDYAKIIHALLDSLKLDKVNVIGVSGGGTTALYLNTIQPDRFKSVITVGAHIYYSKPAREWLANAELNQIMELAKHHDPEKQEYLAKVFWQNKELSDGDPSFTPDKLSAIKAKWLVVLGDNDLFVPIQIGMELYQNVSNSRLWIVPNGGHLPHLNTDFQAEFMRVSLEFLTGKWDKTD